MRDHNLHEVIPTFTNSSKVMDRMVSVQRPISDKTGFGFDPSSPSHLKLTKIAYSSTNEGLKSVFVKGQDSVAEPQTVVDKDKSPQKSNQLNGQITQKVVKP